MPLLAQFSGTHFSGARIGARRSSPQILSSASLIAADCKKRAIILLKCHASVRTFNKVIVRFQATKPRLRADEKRTENAR